ncbi:MAG: dynamin family protein [Actinomycetota bacterium]|nr:dynamin family protein [Actinomycetota bacterium]
MTTTTEETGTSRAMGVIDAAHGAAERIGRPDLMERLAAARERLHQSEVTVLVAGEFKQGKSSLINAIVSAPVCPVDDDVATAVATIVRYAESSEASITYDPLVEEGQEASDIGDGLVSPVRVEDAGAFVVSGRIADTDQRVRAVEIGIPRTLLASGLRLVDTPGVGGLESAHGMATTGALTMADAVIFVTDASQEFTASEMGFLQKALDRCPSVLCAMPKIDFYPNWRRIHELNAGHLERAGLDVEILPVSSDLRQYSVKNDDRELNVESGFPALMTRLRDDIVARAEHTTIRGAMNDVHIAVAQLKDTEQAEHDVLRDPSKQEQLIAEATKAKEQAERMRSAAARWSTTLNDGISDLTSDSDHDMRSRTRALLAELDELIDENDPTDIADELLPMVEQRLMADVAENYERMRNQAIELSMRVLDLFEDDQSGGDVPEVAAPLGLMEESGRLEVDLAERPTLRETVFVGMRGSYGGVMMFGMLGSVVGLATFGPLSLAAGVLLGRKSAKEERKRQLTLRRQQAKLGIKKFIDDVTFRVNKHSRDTLRQIQRDLRDANMTRAQELNTTASEALKAAQSALQADESERTRRLKELDASLDQLQRIGAAATAAEAE